jgi:indole-3-glycerol phosphate synthase
MDALTEVHDEADLEKAVSCGADMIGINNRDLDTFGIDLSTTTNLAPKVPRDCIVVSESGIRSRADIDLLRQAGIQAVLVGTALMRSGDMGKAVRDLA